jgi:hypothetical protein
MTGPRKKSLLQPLQNAPRLEDSGNENPLDGFSDSKPLNIVRPQPLSSGRIMRAFSEEKAARLNVEQAHLKDKEVKSKIDSPILKAGPLSPVLKNSIYPSKHFDPTKRRASDVEVRQSLGGIRVGIVPVSPFLQSKRASLITPLGVELRARAVAEGLPPLLALATQISTRVMGNTVAYRGSGPIPPGLYHAIFTGELRPKPVTEKAKSSTIGPQTGYAASDRRNGRYELNKKGEYHNRPDEIPKHLDGHPLEISLRNIFNDMGTKYALVEQDKNPDENGVLRFYQINHAYDKIQGIIYSVNMNEGQKIDSEILKKYKLVSNHFEHLGKEPDINSKFYNKNLDELFPVSVKHPEDIALSPLMVLGGIVRDCDIDTITDPPPEFMAQRFGPEKTPHAFEIFLKPLDMSAHGIVDDNGEEQAPGVLESDRANDAKALMAKQLLEINRLRWAQYENLKEEASKIAAIEKPDKPFNAAQWSIDNADKQPFVQKNMTLKQTADMVVSVGKGTAMQLYQGLEINVIEQKIRATQLDSGKGTLNITDLDSNDHAVRNAALMVLHAREILYSEKTIATSFIQHPAECHNEHYTCERGAIVAVSGKTIFIGDDQKLSDFVSSNDQYQPINPQWIAPNSLGSKNASIWVKHFLAGYDQHYNNNDPDIAVVKHNVDLYLKNHPEIFQEVLKDYQIHPNKKGSESSKSYLKNFDETLFEAANLQNSSASQMPSQEKSHNVSPGRG